MLKSLYSEEEKNQTYWFVMRVYKNEKTAETRLGGEGGLEYFIPKHYVIRTYHGAKTRCLVPIIPSLVFVHATHNQIIDFKLNSFNMLQFVMWENEDERKYMVVPEKEMSDFIKTCTQTETETIYYKPEEIDLKRGTRIRIHGGSMDGVEGIFARVKGKRDRRLVVMIEGIIAAAVTVKPDLIEVLDK